MINQNPVPVTGKLLQPATNTLKRTIVIIDPFISPIPVTRSLVRLALCEAYSMPFHPDEQEGVYEPYEYAYCFGCCRW